MRLPKVNTAACRGVLCTYLWPSFSFDSDLPCDTTPASEAGKTVRLGIACALVGPRDAKGNRI